MMADVSFRLVLQLHLPLVMVRLWPLMLINCCKDPSIGGVMKSGVQSYLANLALYPGKSELPFLPSNTQAVILQPLGDKGIAIIGGDTIRGFTASDQAWISLIGEKLDATLARYMDNLPLAAQDPVFK
ncbi:hypothetical protein M0R45_022682 [Rubus argutus]|uniref:Uncharacterized protein n=1 Tax=Rubus argutus TaxID=59490 RepID=A0AAW1XGT9_RUBAR